MAKYKISSGVAHKTGEYIRKILISNPQVLSVWEGITPLARNEWICWIMSAKKLETRDRRSRIMCEKLIRGEHRPCCWAGCTHR